MVTLHIVTPRTMQELSDIQKAAAVSLLIEMVNADGRVTMEEMCVFNFISAGMGVSKETFNLGKTLGYEAAVTIVKSLSPEQKMKLAKDLTDIIDADNFAANVEIELLNDICHRTGIDIILNKK